MSLRRGHRQPGQTIVLAAIAMVAVVGGLAMVIDAGIFFVIQRQLQSAADAGALAGAWHDPICVVPSSGCLLSPASPPPMPGIAACPSSSTIVTCEVALANANTVRPLCVGPPTATVATGTTLNLPQHVNAIVVTVECNAGYSFGRILGLSTKHISAHAAAAIGDRDANGDMTDFSPNPELRNPACVPDHCRVARLIE